MMLNRRVRFALLGAVGVVIVLNLIFDSSNAIGAVKSGAVCKKQGIISNGYICKNLKGKLSWSLIPKKKENITLNFPSAIYLGEGAANLSISTLSGLSTLGKSLNPDICSFTNSSISALRLGICNISISTSGNSSFVELTKKISIEIRQKNLFEFENKSPYILSDNYIELPSQSSAMLKMNYRTETPAVCILEENRARLLGIGQCTLVADQSGNGLTDAIQPLQISLKIIQNNQIFFTPPKELSVTFQNFLLSAISSSGLLVSFTSATPEICTINQTTLVFIKRGICTVDASQAGDEFTLPAAIVSASIRVIVTENVITFNPPSTILLKLKTTNLEAKSTSNLEVSFNASPVAVCSVANKILTLISAGMCQITATQAGDEFTVKAQDVTSNVVISVARSTADQPDSLTGYQIKPIYIVSSDGLDRNYDTNGYLTKVLREGNALLKNSVGIEYQIDSLGDDFDIQFFRSSYSTAHFLASGNLISELSKEMKIYENPTLNRKNYVLFIDVPILKNSSACGYAGMPGLVSIVAVGERCTVKSAQVENFSSLAWIHETIHNLGVDHVTDDSCDLMRGSGNCSTAWTVDKDRKYYVGSNKNGVDILTLRVWKGYTSDSKLRASCTLNYSQMPRSDGIKYALCPTGKQIIGAMTSCWSSIRSAELQIWQGNTWISLGSGNSYSKPWGSFVSWECSSSYVAPWIEITQDKPGVQKYRWLVNGSEAEQFNIFWQN